ncbi:MAG: hypothetical protein AB1413_04095 [Thermodesulfobacteriota bacterium]
MQRQIEMENTMLIAHREFMANLAKSLDILEKEISEAATMTSICTDEWCNATEGVIDELHKCIYSISEPRWLTKEDTQGIKKLREKVKNLYAKYKSIRS